MTLMRPLRLLLLTAMVAAVAYAQPLTYTIGTIAGGSTAFDFAEGKPATSILIPSFPKPAAARQGIFYFSLGHRVLRVTPDGAARTYAGTGEAGFAGDGAAATKPQLSAPGSVLLDPQ